MTTSAHGAVVCGSGEVAVDREQLNDLTDLQLAAVGGGCGEVGFA